MKIEDYGFIGDTQTAALVGKDGSIDWLCLPRFDSGACFAALLGDESNGCWKIAPATGHTSTHKYRGDSLILETEFRGEDGRVRLIDCMPPRGKYPDVVRIVEGIEGTVRMRMKLTIRFDYGKVVPWVRRRDGGVVAIAGPDAIILRTDVETHGENLSTVAEFDISAGEKRVFVLTWFPSHEPAPEPEEPFDALASTEKYWRDWADQCTYRGEWRSDVIRSLVTLKGLTYAPTGGIVAAATASVPEELGGVRNWDYRFCWLRDATFTLYALMGAGYRKEASAWRDWLLRAAAGFDSRLQIMYGPAGERNLPEFELPHLRGYEDSRPVRVGNAASEQFQLDVYGEVLDAMHQSRRHGIDCINASWPLEKHLMTLLESCWREPDEGIWEIRGERRHFTHSKMMAWVAVDRAIKTVEDFGLKGDASRWKALRQTIHDEICANSYRADRNTFTQFYGSDKLDASLLMMPLVGFLPVTDSRVRGTIETIERELVSDGFVLRYHPDESGPVDGLPPGEGTFLPCSFWFADCLHLLGREADARNWFERLLSVRTPLGLLSEEYDTRCGRLVGNFPQAFSHVGLVNTACNLSQHGGPAAHRR